MVVGEMAHERDLVIIGGGPGGYTAAIRASQLGRKVTLIERENLGGVCLNKGCIPSKMLTQAASRWKELQKSEEYGFETEGLFVNHEKRLRYKDKVVAQLVSGIASLCKANKIEVISGQAFFLAENKLGVEQNESYEIYKFKDAIIATGSRPVKLETAAVDNIQIIDSWNISSLKEIPDHLVIYGSDAIALEMAMAYRTFISKVTLILDEKEDFSFDLSISRELKRLLKKERITVLKNYKLLEAETAANEVIVHFSVNGEIEKVICSHLFLSGMSSPNSSGIGLERIGVKVTNKGYIEVDQLGRTTIPHIYAVGDVTEGPPLAVRAIKQGKVAAETLAGILAEMDLYFLPEVIHTTPPIACVGLTEEEAIKKGHNVLTSQFPLGSNGYASMLDKKDGFVKIVADQDLDLILGVHIIGHGAVEMISNGTFALEMNARVEDLSFPLYPHPSLNESMLESVEQLFGQAIHAAPKLTDRKPIHNL